MLNWPKWKSLWRYTVTSLIPAASNQKKKNTYTSSHYFIRAQIYTFFFCSFKTFSRRFQYSNHPPHSLRHCHFRYWQWSAVPVALLLPYDRPRMRGNYSISLNATVTTVVVGFSRYNEIELFRACAVDPPVSSVPRGMYKWFKGSHKYSH